MRMRILYTDGTKTLDLFWLTHDGTDVYHGTPGEAAKMSYHRSGKVHRTEKGQRSGEQRRCPLKEAKWPSHLVTKALVNSPRWFEEHDHGYVYSGKKSDAVLVIDSRSLPEHSQLNCVVGLVQPQELGLLSALAQVSQQTTNLPDHEPLQILVATNVVPWVYVVLYKLTPR